MLKPETLLERMKRTGPLPFDALHPLVEQAWIALRDIHARGGTHGDIRLVNLLIEMSFDAEERLAIIDYGDDITATGHGLNAIYYSAPEQIGRSTSVGPSADVYALTTVVFQLLSGQLPYAGRSVPAMISVKSRADARRLSEVMSSPVHPGLDDFIARGLARDPAQRFESAAAALEAWRALRPAREQSPDATSNDEGATYTDKGGDPDETFAGAVLPRGPALPFRAPEHPSPPPTTARPAPYRRPFASETSIEIDYNGVMPILPFVGGGAQTSPPRAPDLSGLPFTDPAAATRATGDGDPASAAPVEAAKSEPEPPPPSEPVPLATCAAIAASCARRPADRQAILDKHGHSSGAYAKAEKRWAAAIQEQTSRGETELLHAYDDAYVAELERERGPITVNEYVRLLVGIERLQVDAVLADLSLPKGAKLRVQRVWLRKIASDAALAKSVRGAMATELKK